MKNRSMAPFFSDSVDVSSSPGTLELAGGIYSGVLLRIAGTNGGSYDPDATYGVVRIDRSRHPTHNIDWGNMRSINNYFGGLTANTAGTTFNGSIYLPFALPGEDSSLWVEDGQIKIYVPSAGTTTATIEAYGIVDPDKPQRYILHVLQETETLTANFAKKFSGLNLSHLVLFRPATTNPTTVEVTVGRRNIKICDSDWEPLEEWTDQIGEIEAASLQAGIIDLNPTGDLGYAINQGVMLREIGGVGAQEMVTISYEIDPVRFHDTFNRVAAQRIDISGSGIVNRGSLATARIFDTPSDRNDDRRVRQGPPDLSVSPNNPAELLRSVSGG